MMNIETLEKELRVNLKSYVSKQVMVDEVVPKDIDTLCQLIKDNPIMFKRDISGIRETIKRHLEFKIGCR